MTKPPQDEYSAACHCGLNPGACVASAGLAKARLTNRLLDAAMGKYALHAGGLPVD